MGNGDLRRAEFERVVGEALETLPKRFADLVENVVIAVEDEHCPVPLRAANARIGRKRAQHRTAGSLRRGFSFVTGPSIGAVPYNCGIVCLRDAVERALRPAFPVLLIGLRGVKRPPAHPRRVFFR